MIVNEPQKTRSNLMSEHDVRYQTLLQLFLDTLYTYKIINSIFVNSHKIIFLPFKHTLNITHNLLKVFQNHYSPKFVFYNII